MRRARLVPRVHGAPLTRPRAAQAALVLPSGELCRRTRAAYARKTACAGASVEQAPDDWVTAFARAASECCGTLSEGRVVDAVVISGQMQNTIVRGRDTCLLYVQPRSASVTP